MVHLPLACSPGLKDYPKRADRLTQETHGGTCKKGQVCDSPRRPRILRVPVYASSQEETHSPEAPHAPCA